MRKKIVRAVGWLLLVVSGYLIATRMEASALIDGVQKLAAHPGLLLTMTVCYGAAFWLRSWAWQKQTVHRVPVLRLWYYHHIGLLLNHLLPVKAGELARMALLRRREGFAWSAAVVSVAGNRLMDMAGLAALAAAALLLIAPRQIQLWYGERLAWAVAVSAAAAAAVLAGSRYAERRFPAVARYRRAFFQGPHGLAAFFLTAAGWLLEAAVVWSVVRALGGQLETASALLVHVLTIIGQTFHVTPGGIGTYEAVMASLLHETAGHSLAFALQVAILSHGFKFCYSFVAGGLAAWRLSLSPLALFREAREASEEGDHEKSVDI